MIFKKYTSSHEYEIENAQIINQSMIFRKISAKIRFKNTSLFSGKLSGNKTMNGKSRYEGDNIKLESNCSSNEREAEKNE